MTILVSFLGELNDTHKALTALVGAFALGVTCITVFYGFTLAELPKQVSQNTNSARENAEAILVLRDDMSSIVCLLTLTDRDQMSPQQMIRECGI